MAVKKQIFLLPSTFLYLFLFFALPYHMETKISSLESTISNQASTISNQASTIREKDDRIEELEQLIREADLKASHKTKEKLELQNVGDEQKIGIHKTEYALQLAQKSIPTIKRLTSKTTELFHASKDSAIHQAVNVLEMADPYLKEATKFTQPYIDQAATKARPHIDKIQTGTVHAYKNLVSSVFILKNQVQQQLKSNKIRSNLAVMKPAWFAQISSPAWFAVCIRNSYGLHYLYFFFLKPSTNYSETSKQKHQICQLTNVLLVVLICVVHCIIEHSCYLYVETLFIHPQVSCYWNYQLLPSVSCIMISGKR